MNSLNSVLVEGFITEIPHTLVAGQGTYFSIVSQRYWQTDDPKNPRLIDTTLLVRVDFPKLAEVVCREGDLDRACRVVGRLEEEPHGKKTRLLLVAEYVEFRPGTSQKS
jgi:hypothetical protein